MNKYSIAQNAEKRNGNGVKKSETAGYKRQKQTLPQNRMTAGG